MTTDAMDCVGTEDERLILVARIYERHAEAICAYLYRLLDDWEAARDLTQDTFLRLLRSKDRLDTVENHRAWVYRIATNRAFDVLRRRRRFSWLPWRTQQHRPQLQWTGMEKEVDESAAVAQALRALPSTYRTALLLFSYHGFSGREAADILEISEGALRTRLYRAREMFRQAYEQEDDR